MYIESFWTASVSWLNRQAFQERTGMPNMVVLPVYTSCKLLKPKNLKLKLMLFGNPKLQGFLLKKIPSNLRLKVFSKFHWVCYCIGLYYFPLTVEPRKYVWFFQYNKNGSGIILTPNGNPLQLDLLGNILFVYTGVFTNVIDWKFLKNY